MTEQLAFDPVAAKAAADEGMGRASRADRVQEWKDAAEILFERIPGGATFTADDIVARIGLPDTGVARNNVVGAWFSSKSKAGAIRFTGRFRKSERVIGHGNLQRVWEKPYVHIEGQEELFDGES